MYVNKAKIELICKLRGHLTSMIGKISCMASATLLLFHHLPSLMSPSFIQVEKEGELGAINASGKEGGLGCRQIWTHA